MRRSEDEWAQQAVQRAELRARQEAARVLRDELTLRTARIEALEAAHEAARAGVC